MKRITMFSSQGMEDTSGFGRCFPMAREFVKKGFHVHILAVHADFSSLKSKTYVKDGVTVHYVGQMHVLKRNNKKFYFNKFKLIQVVVLSTLKMCFYGLKQKTDIIYCFKPQPVNATAALLSKWIKRKPLFLDCDDYEASSDKLSFVQKKVFEFFENNMPRFAHKVSHNTEFIKNHFLKQGYPSEKFVYMPDGVDWSRLQTPDKNKVEKIRHQLGLKGKKVILYFGSISFNFGHAPDLLIKAFPMIKNSVPEAKLLIVGGGDAYEEIQALVDVHFTKDVIFTGRVSFDDLPYYIIQGDISVDPVKNIQANQARYGLKNVESIAMGIPLVTSDVGDRKKIIDNGRVGVLVKAGDVRALADGIIFLLTNDQKRQHMAAECQRVIQRHDWSYLLENFMRASSYF